MSNVRALLGANIRAYRSKSGLSQQALADLAGIHKQTLGYIERGEAWPNHESIHALAQALGVDEAALFHKNAPQRPSPQEALEVISDLVKRSSMDSKI